MNYADSAVRRLSPIVSPSLTFLGGSESRTSKVCQYLSEKKSFKAFIRFPVLFYKPLTTLLGPLGTIVIPPAAQPVKDQLPDYEAELVIVIGKAAKDVSEADALDYVLAYTGANDVSFRKHQFAVSQWGFSKSFGGFISL